MTDEMDPKKVATATVLGMAPQVSHEQPEAQAEDLLHRVLLPLADTLRGQGLASPEALRWHPGAIYLALLRCGVVVMGTEWILEEGGRAKMLQEFDGLLAELKREAGDSFDWALANYTKQEAEKAKHVTQH